MNPEKIKAISKEMSEIEKKVQKDEQLTEREKELIKIMFDFGTWLGPKIAFKRGL